MFIRNLKISTDVRLHPEFLTGPRAFALRRKMKLAGDVFPETDFREDPNDPRGRRKVEKIKVNIHLVRHGAIRIFAVRDAASDWIRSIDLNPSMLLHNTEKHALSKGDLASSLDILRDQIAPLVAEPIDLWRVIPGSPKDGEPAAYWSQVDTEYRFPGIALHCLHGLSHPLTGPAQGAKPNRIQLGDKKDDCLIRLKSAKWETTGPNGLESVEGIRARLILSGRALTSVSMAFSRIGMIDNTSRLVDLTEATLARIHQTVMGRLKGTFLPVPEEWKNTPTGRRLTLAKAMALVAQLTSIPLVDLRAIDGKIRHPSESTQKRLNQDLRVEVARLAPVPVASLFHSSAYAPFLEQ